MATKYTILLLGSGGREHTIAWKLSQSDMLDKLYCAPGNAGTAKHGTNLPFQDSDFQSIHQFVIANNVNMLIVGPENPLVLGIHDYFLETPELAGIPVIGPAKHAAMLEGSKDFAKEFMARHTIPTAAYQTFNAGSFNSAVDFLDTFHAPYVLKADGLAAGKGVVICATKEEAELELREMLLNSKFGKASEKVVIEQFLHGIEMSAFVLTDGNSYCILPEAKDYKRIGNGDTGLNTGGMGCVSPLPFATPEFMAKVEDRIIKPTISGLQIDNIPYKGFIFFGLMNVNGEPFVIEYNCRLGDPETEVILPRLKNDLLELFHLVATNKLSSAKIDIAEETAICVMMVSGGYPGTYAKGMPVHGISNIQNALAFHAGTAFNPTVNQILTNGGRVLGLTAIAPTLLEAKNQVYSQLPLITFDGCYYRDDIGLDLLHYVENLTNTNE